MIAGSINRFAFSICATMAICIGAISSPVHAQEFKQDLLPPSMDINTLKEIDQSTPEGKKQYSSKVREINAKTKKFRDIALNALKGSADVTTNVKEFDLWFTKFEIPQLTLSDVESLRSLPVRRQKFEKLYLITPATNRAGDPNARKVAYERLVRLLLLPSLGKIVVNSDDPTYAPAVKVNALLMIGKLDLKQGKANSHAPIPLPEGMKFLVNVMRSTKLPSYLKPVAMVGLERHALLDSQLKNKASDEERKALQGICVSLLGGKPAEGGEDLDYWMKRKAAKILGFYRSPGPENKIANALINTVNDEDARTWLRYEAIEAYSKLRFPDDASAKAEAFTGEVAKLVLSSLRNEANYLQSERERLIVIKLRQNAAVVSATGIDVGPSMTSPESGDGYEAEMQRQEEERMMQEAEEAMMREEAAQMLLGGGDGITTLPTIEKAAQPVASPFKHEADDDELPEYKVHVSRLRLKTIARSLENVLADDGIAKHSKTANAKRSIDVLKAQLGWIKQTAEFGVQQPRVALTMDMISQLNRTADGLAREFKIKEVVPEKKEVVKATLTGTPKTETKVTKKGDTTKKGGGGEVSTKTPEKKKINRVNGAPEKTPDPFE